MTGDVLHGVVICGVIVGTALLIVGIGCLLLEACAAGVDRHVSAALAPAGFNPETEQAITEALRLGVPDDVDEQRLRVALAAFEDELAARRASKTVTR